MITGINHLTLAVRDLERSFDFYTRVMGLQPVVKWSQGAIHSGDLESRLAELRETPYEGLEWYR